METAVTALMWSGTALIGAPALATVTAVILGWKER